MSSNRFVVRLQGGLGNQMFQFAFGRALSKVSQSRVKFDSRFLAQARTPRALELIHFSLSYEEAQKKDLHSMSLGTFRRPGTISAGLSKSRLLPAHDVFTEKHPFNFDPDPFCLTGNRYFIGYWQAVKYFFSIRNDLRRDFLPRAPLSEEALALIAWIQSSNPVCLHVRRGDFAHDSRARKHHGLLPKTYYEAALNRLPGRESNRSILIFSDDPAWCARNFSWGNSRIVGEDELQNFMALHVMSHCSAFVIANSSFSWWAAWLADDGAAVVAPNDWVASPRADTSGLMPPHWIRL